MTGQGPKVTYKYLREPVGLPISMLLGLISDTHDCLPAIDLALELFEDEGVEAVLHAGDWVAPFSAKRFKRYSGSLYGAYGNNDGERIGLSRAFREMEAVVKGEFTAAEIAGYKFAVMHGTNHETVEAVARSRIYPFVIYGHSHKASIERFGDVLVVNPGEACGYLTGRRTVGLLDVERKTATIRDLR